MVIHIRMHRGNKQIEIHHFSLYISFLHVHGSCLAYIHKCAQMPHASYHNSAQVGLFLLRAWRMYVPVCSTCTFEWYAHVWWSHVCIRHDLHLAYGWHPWNFSWPIRIQHVGKNLTVLTSMKVNRTKHWIKAIYLTGDWLKYSWKRDLQFPKPYQTVKSEIYETLCVSTLAIWHQKWVTTFRHGS